LQKKTTIDLLENKDVVQPQTLFVHGTRPDEELQSFVPNFTLGLLRTMTLNTIEQSNMALPQLLGSDPQ
jgi:hypothetical protein